MKDEGAAWVHDGMKIHREKQTVEENPDPRLIEASR